MTLEPTFKDLILLTVSKDHISTILSFLRNKRDNELSWWCSSISQAFILFLILWPKVYVKTTSYENLKTLNDAYRSKYHS